MVPHLGSSTTIFQVLDFWCIADIVAYQRHKAMTKLCNGLRNTLNGICTQKLWHQEVDVSTSLLGAHIPFATSFLRVRVLNL
jgi:hypothetical protein